VISATWIQNARVLLPDGSIEPRSVLFDDCIRGIYPPDRAAPKGVEVLEAGQRLLTAGLMDLHTHGIGRHAFERSPEDLRCGLEMAPRFGVTTILPTLYRVLRPESFGLLEQLAEALTDAAGPSVPGFHLEGPFLAITGAGALTMKPDVALLNDLVAACRRKVAAMSISPEMPGIIAVIERLCELGVIPFITHTRATAEETQAAIDAGARHATHFYDVFPVPPEKEPGVRPVGAVEAILADPRVTVDFICDGVHVHPVAVRAALAAKGPRGVAAITDSNVGAGLPAGTYDTPWGYRVRIAPGDAARIADADHPGYAALSGSSLTMNNAVANLHRWVPAPGSLAWMMATRNPAGVLRLSDRGSIEISSRADLVLWEKDLRPRCTWVQGRRVYEAQSDESKG
jgi:N-acetylglucosamine-6-phosphate deacetylase